MKMKLSPLLILPLTLAMSNTAKAELKVGDNAPAVTGITETGDKLNLGDVYAKQPYTLVYFFPKADTPGCTAQGCSLRDAYEDLTKKGVAVIGVSLDQAEAQKAFKEKFHFPFTLIADPDQTRRQCVRCDGQDGPDDGPFCQPRGLPDQGRQDRLGRLPCVDGQTSRGCPEGPGRTERLTGPV